MAIQVNDRITLKNNLHGVVRYIGPVDGKQHDWVGIELEEPRGSNNGAINGKRYFYCPDGYGLFVKYERLTQKMTSIDGDGTRMDMQGFQEMPERRAGSIFDSEVPRTVDQEVKYKELLTSFVEKCNASLELIRRRLQELQRKIDTVKGRSMPEKDGDSVFQMVTAIIEAEERSDTERFQELCEAFKKMMWKYKISVGEA